MIYQEATEQCPRSIQVILKKPDPNLEFLYTGMFYTQVPLAEKFYVLYGHLVIFLSSTLTIILSMHRQDEQVLDKKTQTS